jgi:hypothetical protein
MAELIDVIKGELVTTPAEQQAVIDLSIPVTYSRELRASIDIGFATIFTSSGTSPATPNLSLIPTWRNFEIVSPLNVGPFTPTNPDDLDGDVWLNEQMGGDTLAALSAQCAGKAVLIQRGGLNFDLKILNAIAAGAVMVILYNSNVGGNGFFNLFLNAAPGSFTIPIFQIGNDIGQKVLSYLRSNIKIYATVESLAYSPSDNYLRLRLTEIPTTPPTASYPLVFNGTLDQNTVVYTVTTWSKPSEIIVYNSSTELITIRGQTSSINMKYRLIANRPYRFLNSIAEEIAPTITRAPISASPTIRLINPTFVTNSVLGPNVRNQLNMIGDVSSIIRFNNSSTLASVRGYDMYAGPGATNLYLEETINNELIVNIPYNLRMRAIDLNTGSAVFVSTNGGATYTQNYEFVRLSCLITNISVVGNTLTFTSEKSIQVDIVRNPGLTTFQFFKSVPIVSGSNTISIADLTAGNYGLYDADPNLTFLFNTAGVATLGTFTKA